MIRMNDLPRAIYGAINGWRLWITLAMLAFLILNEAIAGWYGGQTIVESLTRIPYYRMLYLILVCGIIAQAAIGAVPFTGGILMTLYDAVIKRRQGWKREGREEGRDEGRAEGRAEERREKIAAVLADPRLSAEEKNLFIEILNSDGPA